MTPRGRPTIPRPPRAAMIRLYLREGLAIRDIAARLNTSKDTVARTLKEHGITRPRAPKPSRTAVMRLYKAEGSVRGVAALLGLSVGATVGLMKAYGLRTRPQGRPKAKVKTRAEFKDIETYVKAHGVEAACRRFGVSHMTLWRRGIRVK